LMTTGVRVWREPGRTDPGQGRGRAKPTTVADEQESAAGAFCATTTGAGMASGAVVVGATVVTTVGATDVVGATVGVVGAGAGGATRVAGARPPGRDCASADTTDTEPARTRALMAVAKILFVTTRLHVGIETQERWVTHRGRDCKPYT
jgi:hypothetical protein